MVPVLIVGGGPAGLTASLLLSRLGVPSLLVERRRAPSPLPRARGVHARAVEVLRSCGANMDDLRKNLTQHVSEQTPRIAADREVDTQPTLGFQRVIQRAILHVQSSGKKEVTGANVLVAIFGEKDSHAVYFLQQQGITRLDVVNYISHGITKSAAPQGAKADGLRVSEMIIAAKAELEKMREQVQNVE